MIVLLLVLGLLALFGWLAAEVGDPERDGLNWALGVLLGPIGILIAAVIRNSPSSPHSSHRTGDVEYNLVGWGPQGQLAEALRRQAIPHQWAGSKLSIARAYEPIVDRLIGSMDEGEKP